MDGWMFAWCGHLGAAPQHGSIRMRADLVAVFFSVSKHCHSSIKGCMHGTLQWVLIYCTEWHLRQYSDLFRGSFKGFVFMRVCYFFIFFIFYLCLHFKMNHYKSNFISFLSACRLSCHKKCEVKVRHWTSFAPYCSWVIAWYHNLCTPTCINTCIVHMQTDKRIIDWCLSH